MLVPEVRSVVHEIDERPRDARLLFEHNHVRVVAERPEDPTQQWRMAASMNATVNRRND